MLSYEGSKILIIVDPVDDVAKTGMLRLARVVQRGDENTVSKEEFLVEGSCKNVLMAIPPM